MQAKTAQDQWLDRVQVASPCSESWDTMSGDKRVRACDRCEMNVYNLSGMGRKEAEALVANSEGRLCVRFFRRADGTIMTKDCPTGLAAARRRVALVATGVFALLVGVVGWAAAAWSGSSGGEWRGAKGLKLPKILKPDPPVEMGEVCIGAVQPAPPQPVQQVPIDIDYAAQE